MRGVLEHDAEVQVVAEEGYRVDAVLAELEHHVLASPGPVAAGVDLDDACGRMTAGAECVLYRRGGRDPGQLVAVRDDAELARLSGHQWVTGVYCVLAAKSLAHPLAHGGEHGVVGDRVLP